jgi:diaminopimelate decarboxylase
MSGDAAEGVTPAIDRFVAEHPRLETPYLVMDLDVVAERYHQLRSALPVAQVLYAVKANPSTLVLRRLAAAGSSFDVASPGEIELCLQCGIAPSRMSYGNTIKKERDIAFAYEAGVRTFTVDSRLELDKVLRHAPACTVYVRIVTDGAGADWPLLISERPGPAGQPPKRWVYLDIGMFNGLAETLEEAIRYRIRVPSRRGRPAPVVIAGPTCDSADVLYEKSAYELPDDLRIGDRVRILSAGAYTSSYSSVCFNGFEPLTTHHVAGLAEHGPEVPTQGRRRDGGCELMIAIPSGVRG